MAEYMGGPYEPRSLFSVTVDGTVITKFGFVQTDDGVVMKLLDENEELIGEVPFPDFDASTKYSGAFTGALYDLFNKASLAINAHVADSSIHLTKSDRQVISDFTTSNPLTMSIAFDCADTSTFHDLENNGDTLPDLLGDIDADLIYLKNQLSGGVNVTATDTTTWNATASKVNTIEDAIADLPDAATVDEKIATAVAAIDTVDVDPAVTVSGTTWRVESHVDSNGKTWVKASANFLVTKSITEVVSYSSVNYCANNVLGTVAYPVTFSEEPEIYVGVHHNTNKGGDQGVGVWAVLSHTATDLAHLPTVRLQCASSVANAYTYNVSVHVEGYKA